MPDYVMCLQSSGDEANVANQWARTNHATRIGDSSRSQAGALANVTAADTILVVGHGSPTEIGTAGSRVTYTPTTFAAYLINVMGLSQNATIAIHCCDTGAFATALQAQLLARGRACVVRGQAARYSFTATSPA